MGLSGVLQWYMGGYPNTATLPVLRCHGGQDWCFKETKINILDLLLVLGVFKNFMFYGWLLNYIL